MMPVDLPVLAAFLGAVSLLVMSPGPGTIEQMHEVTFTDTALRSETGRVAISQEYVALRDEIFESIT